MDISDGWHLLYRGGSIIYRFVLSWTNANGPEQNGGIIGAIECFCNSHEQEKTGKTLPPETRSTHPPSAILPQGWYPRFRCNIRKDTP